MEQTRRYVPENWLEPFRLADLFAAPAPFEVDVGCGKGRFLLARAAAHPEINYLGVDRMLRRIRKVDRKAVRAGRRLELTAQEFGLLALFVRRQGEVLSRTEIAEQVWDMNFDSATNVIDVAVRRLRNKLDAPFERTLLHTVRGMGYVLESRAE